MKEITLTGLDPHQLAELEQRILTELELAADRHNEVYGGTDVDKGNWYGLAIQRAAQVLAVEFKLARGE